MQLLIYAPDMAGCMSCSLLPLLLMSSVDIEAQPATETALHQAATTCVTEGLQMMESQGKVDIDQPAVVICDGHGGIMPLQTTTGAFFNLLKPFIASGVPGLPAAYAQSGLWLSVYLMIPIAILCFWCMLSLYISRGEMLRRKELSLGSQDSPAPAGSVATAALSTFSEMMEYAFGERGRMLLTVWLVLAQLGFCTVYVIFIASNLNFLVPSLSVLQWMLIIWPLRYAVVLLRSMRLLSPVSILASCCVLFGIFMIFSDAAALVGTGSGVQNAVVDGLPNLVSVSVFAFEGIPTILPIACSLERPQDFPKILGGVIAVVAAIYTSFGAVCYSAYGSAVKAPISLQLPSNSGTTFGCFALLIFAVYGSYLLQAFPLVEMMEIRLFGKPAVLPSHLERTSPSRRVLLEMGRNAARCLVVSATIGLAALIPNFDIVLGLVGSFCCIPLMMIFPPLLHRRAREMLVKDHPKHGIDSVGSWFVDWGILVLGVAVWGLTSALALMSAIRFV